MRFLVILSIALTASTSALPRFDGGSSNSNDKQLVGVWECPELPKHVPVDLSIAYPDLIDFLKHEGEDDTVQILLKYQKKALCALWRKNNPEGTTPSPGDGTTPDDYPDQQGTTPSGEQPNQPGYPGYPGKPGQQGTTPSPNGEQPNQPGYPGKPGQQGTTPSPNGEQPNQPGQSGQQGTTPSPVHWVPGTDGTPGHYEPGTNGSPGYWVPGTDGTPGQYTPGTNGSPGYWVPGTDGTPGHYTPGTKGTPGHYEPGQDGQNPQSDEQPSSHSPQQTTGKPGSSSPGSSFPGSSSPGSSSPGSSSPGSSSPGLLGGLLSGLTGLLGNLLNGLLKTLVKTQPITSQLGKNPPSGTYTVTYLFDGTPESVSVPTPIYYTLSGDSFPIKWDQLKPLLSQKLPQSDILQRIPNMPKTLRNAAAKIQSNGEKLDYPSIISDLESQVDPDTNTVNSNDFFQHLNGQMSLPLSELFGHASQSFQIDQDNLKSNFQNIDSELSLRDITKRIPSKNTGSFLDHISNMMPNGSKNTKSSSGGLLGGLSGSGESQSQGSSSSSSLTSGGNGLLSGLLGGSSSGSGSSNQESKGLLGSLFG